MTPNISKTTADTHQNNQGPDFMIGIGVGVGAVLGAIGGPLAARRVLRR